MQKFQQDNYYVITGGPGSGKSSLIFELEKRGFAAVSEAGRAIIREQLKTGGNAQPWADRQLYAELMLERELNSYCENMKRAGRVFFDRGIPDTLGYLNLCKLPVPAHMLQAAGLYRYNRLVFIAPPWQEIFIQDNERKQNWQEAEATYYAMMEVYTALDYQLVELPKASIAVRVEFILNKLDLHQ